MSYKASFDNIITTNKMIPIFNYLVEQLNEDVVSIIINKWFIKDHEYKFRSCLTSINNIKHNYNFICGAQSIDLIQNFPFSINQYILEQNRTEIATKYRKIKRDSVYSII